MNASKKDKEEKEPLNEVGPSVNTAVASPAAPKRGLEELVDREDLIIPRASLLQSKSPEVEDAVYAHLGLKPGMIINSLTKKVLPESFIPIVRFVNWIRFNPRDKKHENFDPSFEPGAIMWMSNDPHDPRVQREGGWGANGEKPLATKFVNFLSYFPGVDMPIIVSFAKTSFAAGKELTSLVKFTPGDTFSRKYKIVSKQEKNDLGSWFEFKIAQLGEEECIPTAEEFALAELWYTEMSKRTQDIKVHDQASVDAENPTKPAKEEPKEW